ncbi:GNAT family N-acetyltransferase [Gracilibacillus sp. S3-1-1]|uniref:GNAT family N-acetyltransferase n=1 Tax=Gracilibacillus pellucidus TaxID=3095368 RepID=A0ACC6M2Y9_9BACI|nr:GNAT family N-acetyltransferase [Gracilibacillus sp. S3-1-1]MDX8045256.1 GNAT family N-acetyltransferase [Gracilibacillus sp. S3-1-1]
MEIRQLHKADADHYYVLRLEALQESPQSFAASYEEEKMQTVEKYQNRLATTENAVSFGAFIDDHLVGMVTLIKEKPQNLRHRASLVAMYVKPEARRQGIAQALVTTVIEQARQMSEVEQLYLSVVTSNEPAKRLYQSLGFAVFGTEKRALKIDNVYYDEEHMVLFLED